MTNRRFRVRQIRLFLRLALPIGLSLVALIAAAAGLYRLESLPPGLLNAEAAHGLLARDAGTERLALITQAGDQSPLLANLIAIAGRLLGFDALSARIGAVLAWAGAIILTGRWLGSVMGPGWGFAGGFLMATSLWPILFGRLALSPVAGMFALAAFLFLIRKAIYEDEGIVWYAAAGIAAGIAIVADPALRVLPFILLLTLLLSTRIRPDSSNPRAAGLLASMITASMVVIPYVADRHEDLYQIDFWARTPGLTTGPLSNLSSVPANYVMALTQIFWNGDASPALNLPAASLLGPFLAPWAIVGLIIALKRARKPFTALLMTLGALLILPAALTDPVHLGRLLPALPLLIVLPLLAMQALLQQTHQQRRLAAFVLISLTLIGNVVWSGWHYAGWVRSEQTAAVFAPGIVASLAAVGDLSGDEPVIYSTYGHQQILAYLGREQPWRIDVDARDALPLPIDQNGYLVVPEETPPDPALLALFQGIPAQQGDGYEMYRIDDRVREQLPFSVPTTRYVNGAVFLGHDLEPDEDERLTVRLAWRFPAGSAQQTVRLVQRPVGDHRAAQYEIRTPSVRIDAPHLLVMVMRLDPPPAGSTMDLWVTLLANDDDPVAGDGVDQAGELFLNRYEFMP